MVTSPRLSRRTLLAGVGIALGTVALAGRSAMAEEKDKADAEADKGDAEDDKDKADAEPDKGEADRGRGLTADRLRSDQTVVRSDLAWTVTCALVPRAEDESVVA